MSSSRRFFPRIRRLQVPLLARCVLAFGFALAFAAALRSPLDPAPQSGSRAVLAQDTTSNCTGEIVASGQPGPSQPTFVGAGTPEAVESPTPIPTIVPTIVPGTNWFLPSSAVIQLGAYSSQAEPVIAGVEVKLPLDTPATSIVIPSQVLLRNNEGNGASLYASVLSNFDQLTANPTTGVGFLCVQVDHVPRIGVYSGVIDVQSGDLDPAELSVVLEVFPRPALTVAPATWTESSWVDCREFLWKLDCRLAGFLFGVPMDDMLKPSILIVQHTMPNSVPVGFTIPAPIVYRGDGTQPLVTAPFIVSPETGIVADGERTNLTISANPDAISPGRYRGTIDLVVPDSTVNRISVPVSLSIQTGPIWVIVALALGIAMAQLLQWWEQTGSRRRLLFRRLDDLEEESLDLKGEQSWIIAQHSIAEAKRSIQKHSNEAATVSVDLARQRIGQLLELDRIASLSQKCSVAEQAELQQLLLSVQLLLSNGMDEEATEHMGRMKEKLKVCSGDWPANPFAQTERRTRQDARATVEPEERGNWAERNLAKMFHSRVPAHYRGVWLLATLVVWGVLLWLGIEALYLNSSVTFTGESVRQYIPLLAWGFGTQAVTRSVSGLFPR